MSATPLSLSFLIGNMEVKGTVLALLNFSILIPVGFFVFCFLLLGREKKRRASAQLLSDSPSPRDVFVLHTSVPVCQDTFGGNIKTTNHLWRVSVASLMRNIRGFLHCVFMPEKIQLFPFCLLFPQ